MGIGLLRRPRRSRPWKISRERSWAPEAPAWGEYPVPAALRAEGGLRSRQGADRADRRKEVRERLADGKKGTMPSRPLPPARSLAGAAWYRCTFHAVSRCRHRIPTASHFTTQPQRLEKDPSLCAAFVFGGAGSHPLHHDQFRRGHRYFPQGQQRGRDFLGRARSTPGIGLGQPQHSPISCRK